MNIKSPKKCVCFEPRHQVVDIHGESSILDLALKNDIEIDHACGGSGSCGTCRVIVENVDILPERNEVEQAMAEDRGFTKNERLACQNDAVNGLIIRLSTE